MNVGPELFAGQCICVICSLFKSQMLWSTVQFLILQDLIVKCFCLVKVYNNKVRSVNLFDGQCMCVICFYSNHRCCDQQYNFFFFRSQNVAGYKSSW